MTKQKFFVAVVMPGPIAAEIRAFQQYAAEHFRSQGALRSPPHITLVPPFTAEQLQADRIPEILESEVSGVQRIQLTLKGFDAFTPRVIFVHVEPNVSLENLARVSCEVLRDHGFHIKEEHRPFHPHVTVAFKDLRRDVFKDAFAHFSQLEYQRDFSLQQIALLRHQEGRWVVIRDIPV